MDSRIHLHFRTADLDRSRTFYEALLGAPDKHRDDLVRFQPEGVPLSLTLMVGEPPALGPDEHFGVKWPTADAARQAWSRIETAGLSSDHTEDEVACCGAVQTKRWFVDPDGRAWEVYTVLDDSEAVPTFPARRPSEEDPAAASSGSCCGQETTTSAGCCA